MKLSQLSTERATDVLCELTPYIANIVEDSELMESLRSAIDTDKVKTKAELIAIGAGKVTRLVPIILKKRRSDVYGILAVLNEKSVEEIAKQNLLVTIRQIKGMAKDKELVDFFKSWADTEESE